MPAAGSLGVVFDHAGIAVSDLGVSERFNRTVLDPTGTTSKSSTTTTER